MYSLLNNLAFGHGIHELAAMQLVDYLTKQMNMGKVPINIYIY